MFVLAFVVEVQSSGSSYDGKRAAFGSAPGWIIGSLAPMGGTVLR